ncbi:DNA cytosine methyltransferase [Acinetobacter baumannii]|uniref:DNA cytosine methyltransferase n=1 Tax=Acinetobacter baumannii TaxID=470 RepID=UPI001CB86868|nr:DNA cytosine methyltransferase [Acinetobacter baumannii]MCA4087119.1 DNA cytosine methyltransferase [Acinetobacter baumannii]
MNNLAINEISSYTHEELITYSDFMKGVLQPKFSFNYVSLFSGSGISDFGLSLLGGNCLAACEKDPARRLVHETNIAGKVYGDIKEEKDFLIKYVKKQRKSVDLIIATPPCQSFSSANSQRGKLKDHKSAANDSRNFLFFDALDICLALQPKFILIENVPNFGRRLIRHHENGVLGHVEEFIESILSNYIGTTIVRCVSEFGVPQSRKRSFSLYIRKDICKKVKITAKDLKKINFEKLIVLSPNNIMEAIGHLSILDSKSDSKSKDTTDIFHHVPVLGEKHYSWISNIPVNSGKSAWQNACENCGDDNTPIFQIKCVACNKEIKVRPHIEESDGSIRSIRGFKSSYKRINPTGLSSAITTNTNAFSSDNKLHPNQNRVLSVRECMLIQSIPENFIWPEQIFYKSMHLVREMVGEALPPLVSYQLAHFLLSL